MQLGHGGANKISQFDEVDAKEFGKIGAENMRGRRN
jgi:hypothetical protein